MHSTARRIRHVKCSFTPSWKFISTTSVRKNTAVTLKADNIEPQHDPRLASAKPFDEMPRIASLPFIGSAWAYFPIVGRYRMTKLHLADRHKHQVYGDVVRERFGPLNVVMSFRPEDMETILKHEGKYPKRFLLPTFDVYRASRKQWYTTPGIAILQGKDWYDLRSKVQPHLMKPKAAYGYLNSMQDVAKDFSPRIRYLKDKNNEVPNLLRELNKWALESIAVVGLDTKLGCLKKELHPDSDAVKMIENVETIFETMNNLEAHTGNVPFWKYFSTPTWKKFTRANDIFTEIAYKHIKNSYENLKNSTEDKELTLLQAMLTTKEISFSEAMVTVIDMMIAGIASTATTAGYLMYHLAKNPEKQEKLYQDLTRILPSKSDKITTETFNEIRYLKYCLKESLRMDPVSRGSTRILDHDVVISGYRVPAGSLIMVVQQVISRKAKYFKDPDEFIPERWADQENKPNPFAYLPFGFGPRTCAGRRFAELEVICLISEIVRNYRIEYHHEDIGMYTRTFNHPNKPFRFKFIER